MESEMATFPQPSLLSGNAAKLEGKTGYTPALTKHLSHLNDSLRNSSSTEAGVLIACHQATARHIPKKISAITGGGIQSLTITILPREASARLRIRRPLTGVASPLLYPKGSECQLTYPRKLTSVTSPLLYPQGKRVLAYVFDGHSPV
ncbi:hypothetical protein AVEN_263052-1 [Araneus ventricosus]|uniref:Uncharacterized protein n=1 Tax=Araneus ventricosus TaxID=182803 RepID=A0A4Y2PI32_ARAVE|nr:hypothetical protein AVEN_263052-1 [Araneus ventricosus]